ncbi:MAG: ATP-binding protein [Bacteroidales bacterium]|nr:ATP-binding protein [Bacteroidales bacterium]
MKQWLTKSSFVHLLFLILISSSVTITASPKTSYHADSIVISKWLVPINDSLFIKPDAILPWMDSLKQFAAQNESPYVDFTYNNSRANYFWATIQYDSALGYYRKAYQYALKGNLKRPLVYVLGNLGILYNYLGNFDSSTYYYTWATNKAKEFQLYDTYVRNIINHSFILNQHAQYSKSIVMLHEAQQISARLNNAELDALLASALANVYYSLNDIDQMHKHLRVALSYYKDTQNQPILTTHYVNFAESFSSLVFNYDSAFFYFNKALAISNDRNRPEILNAIDFTKGNLNYQAGRFDSAEIFYLRSLNNPLTEKHLRRKTALLINLANVYRKTEDYKAARHYYTVGERFADSLHFIEYQLNAILGLVRIDSALKNYEQAFFKNQEYQGLKETLNKTEVSNSLKVMEAERNLEVQKLENELLEKENLWQQNQILNQRILVVFILLGFVGSLIFTIVQLRNSKKIRRLNTLLNNNIAKLDEQNAALDKASKTKDKFFGILSHDLRSPSATLQTGLSMLNKEWDDFSEEERTHLIHQLDQTSENTHALLEDLLRWTQIQQGGLKVSATKFRLADLVEELRLLFYMALSQKQQTLTTRINQYIEMMTDYQMLKQILHNLLSNAIKFTSRGGNITIEAAEDETGLKISVIDNGIGIPQDMLGRLFDLDTDFGRPGTENEKSSGMGLILCKDYATLLGATLGVDSKKDQGSNFSLHFHPERKNSIA